MKVERINEDKRIETIPDNNILRPQIKWQPEGWLYLYSPGDCEILVKETDNNYRFLTNMLEAMKKGIELRKIDNSARMWNNIIGR